MTVTIDLTARPAPGTVIPLTDGITYIDDLDCFADSTRCSCAASDDNPY